ncbi:MAG TPA: DUF3999 family protein, partial [Usitatibacter sp.]|nr:DUF3999 family protein [Usitatibacter sp.]
PPVEIERRFMRRVRLEYDASAAELGDRSPVVEAQWRPAQIVFAARGIRPFTLAFNNPSAQRTAVAMSELIPGYHPGDEKKVAEDKVLHPAAATVAASAGVPAPPPSGFSQRVIRAANEHRAAILVALTAMIGWIAWRRR